MLVARVQSMIPLPEASEVLSLCGKNSDDTVPGFQFVVDTVAPQEECPVIRRRR